MNVIEKVIGIVKLLDEIQDYTDNLPTHQSILDSKISDLEHLVENNNIKTKGSYRIIKELEKITKERRQYKNDMELTKTLNTHYNKLLNKNCRQMLLSELGKTQKRLNQPYKYRVYQEEEIKELMGV